MYIEIVSNVFVVLLAGINFSWQLEVTLKAE